jgi:hypothetical protein
MTDSFYEQIEKIEESHWNYYFGGPDNIPLDKPFVTVNTAKAFMGEYFSKGGKRRIPEAFDLDSFQDARADHTVAVFFLGALLLKNTGFGSQEFFEGKIEKWYEFTLFMWFVTCLAHDAAFYLEKDRFVFAKADTVEQLYNELSIDHRLLDRNIGGVPGDLLNCVKPYFNYRHAEGRTDHGIYGGILAFDVLVKNRIDKKSQGDVDPLYWAEDLDSFYAIAAATIATHNIWLPENEETIEKYGQAGLNSLIGRAPVTFREGPLLYFLGLIDTIDPVKAYGRIGISVLEVLKNVHIDYKQMSFTLTVSGRLEEGVLHEQAKRARDWLAIDYITADRSVTISFHIE